MQKRGVGGKGERRSTLPMVCCGFAAYAALMACVTPSCMPATPPAATASWLATSTGRLGCLPRLPGSSSQITSNNCVVSAI